jgi:chemotaxis protein CheD
MQKPDHVIEIFLQPGDFYFGDKDTRIRTILGSCVSITMWHPRRLIGGMCHYMLPSRNVKRIGALDGRYAEEAVLMFFQEAMRHDTNPKDYVVKVFGAGNMFPGLGRKQTCGPRSTKGEIDACSNVSCKNAAIVYSLASNYGFSIETHDLGGEGHRQVVFDIWSGNVWVRRPAMQKAHV